MLLENGNRFWESARKLFETEKFLKIPYMKLCRFLFLNPVLTVENYTFENLVTPFWFFWFTASIEEQSTIRGELSAWLGMFY